MSKDPQEANSDKEKSHDLNLSDDKEVLIVVGGCMAGKTTAALCLLYQKASRLAEQRTSDGERPATIHTLAIDLTDLPAQHSEHTECNSSASVSEIRMEALRSLLRSQFSTQPS